MKTNNIEERDCIVAFFDIFGFSEILKIISQRRTEKNIPFAYPYKDIKWLLNSLLEIWGWIYKEIKKDDHVLTYLFSDCGFILYRVNGEKENTLKICIQNLGLLMDKCLEKGFFIRGGISYGKVAYNENLFIGQPVIEAHKLESLYCPGPFIIIPDREIKKIIDTDSFIAKYIPYILTLKHQSGKMRCRIIFPIDIEQFMTKIKNYAEYFLVYGPFDHAKFWHDAYEFAEDVFKN